MSDAVVLFYRAAGALSVCIGMVQLVPTASWTAWAAWHGLGVACFAFAELRELRAVRRPPQRLAEQADDGELRW